MAFTKSSGGSRTRMPSKMSINFAEIEKEKKNYYSLVVIILVVVGVGYLFGKFMIYDRLQEVKKEKAITEDLQNQIVEANNTIQEFGKLATEFAHYTYSGMTDEEITRTDRMAMIQVIDDVVRKRCTVNSWSIYGNKMDITITSDDAGIPNRVKELLDQNPQILTCSVRSVYNGKNEDNIQVSTANFLIIFRPKAKEVQAE